MSRGDEAIAAAEVLVLRDELDSSRRKEAVTAKALGERSEVRRPVWRTPNFLLSTCGHAYCVRATAQECDAWMTSHRQLELEHAVLQERLGELEEARAADSRDGRGQTAHISAVSSADMYAQLANSSDWSARQMGAIEGTLTHMPHTAFSVSAKRCAGKHLFRFLPPSIHMQ